MEHVVKFDVLIFIIKEYKLLFGLSEGFNFILPFHLTSFIF